MKGKLNCSVCDQTFKQGGSVAGGKYMLNLHKKSAHRSKKQCNFCSYEGIHLEDHFARRHSLKAQNLICKCEYCYKEYKTKAGLYYHKKTLINL